MVDHVLQLGYYLLKLCPFYSNRCLEIPSISKNTTYARIVNNSEQLLAHKNCGQYLIPQETLLCNITMLQKSQK